jgi:hypothetical protein
VTIFMGGCTEDAAHPSSAHNATHSAAAVLALAFPAFHPALADDPRGTLTRDRNTWRNRREVERFANEVAERDDELRRLDRAARDAIRPAHLLTARREADYTDGEGNRDLWRTTNILQESLMRGGLSGTATTGRKVTTKAVKSVTGDLAINRGLWTLATEMAKLA